MTRGPLCWRVRRRSGNARRSGKTSLASAAETGITQAALKRVEDGGADATVGGRERTRGACWVVQQAVVGLVQLLGAVGCPERQ